MDPPFLEDHSLKNMKNLSLGTIPLPLQPPLDVLPRDGQSIWLLNGGHIAGICYHESVADLLFR